LQVLSFLLAYVNYTKKFLCDICNTHIMYFDQIHPIYIIFNSLPTTPRTFFTFYLVNLLSFPEVDSSSVK
jgi:hypothetical protein